ncbi:hypothetical protein Hypma_005839 [Hypsizygus marmoreus]|uniref:Uncharacterized protein n=1 Tax=Hypsizygus marmoreus TaxID=39966 RepID=A0A369K893_HYPMA|nr:hypothetical protein Hypma_005839 [Hypsizygus marmoreus]
MPPKNAKSKSKSSPSVHPFLIVFHKFSYFWASSDTPRRQIQKKTELSKAEVDAIIADALSGGPPSSINISSGKGKAKRKAEDVTPQSYSDIEEIDPPPPATKKRRGTSSTNHVSTDVTAAGPAKLSIAKVLDLALEAASKPMAAPPANDSVSAMSSTGRPVRNRVKTEKARNPDVPEKESPSVPASGKKKKTLERVHSEAAAAREKWAEVKKEPVSPPNVAHKRDGSLPPSDNESLPEVSELVASPVIRRRGHGRRKLPDSDDDQPKTPVRFLSSLPDGDDPADNPFLDTEALEEGADGSDADAGERSVVGDADGEQLGSETGDACDESGSAQGVDDGSKGHDLRRAHSEDQGSEGNASASGSDVDDEGKTPNVVEVDDSAVMQESLWEPQLTAHYKSLPALERFCEVTPFTYAKGDGSTLRVTVGNMAKGMRREELPNLIRGIMFKQSGFYINTACIDPSLLYVDSRRLKITATKQPAVCVMIGLVTECYLRSSVQTGGNQSQYAVHRLTVAPAPQEMRRDMSTWGLLFGFSEMPAPITDSGFSFNTFGEGKFPTFASSAPSTPKKATSRYATAFTSPVMSKARAAQRYDQGLAYEVDVPIYDGRPGKNRGKPFTFSDEDFNGLSTWPLYAGGKHDIPSDSIVAVGYTLATFNVNKIPPVNLCSNIHFVVVLSTPSRELA